MTKETAEPRLPDADHSASLSLAFADNSSYLGAKDTARLQRFAKSLSASCKVRMTATVAGSGADARYAGWLAERRLSRVTDLLRANAIGEITAEVELVSNDARRLVVVSLPDEADCGEARSITIAANQ